MSWYFTFLKVYKTENLWFAKTTHWIVNSQTNGPNGSTYTFFFFFFSLIIHIISPLFSNTWNGFNKYQPTCIFHGPYQLLTHNGQLHTYDFDFL